MNIETAFFVIAISVALIVSLLYLIFKIQEKRAKLEYESYRPSKSVEAKFKAKYPGITFEEMEMVWEALSSYFKAIKFMKLNGNKQSLGMPSVIVDDLWHEMILDTRNYMSFCDKFFDGYVHHNPGDVEFKTDFTNSNVNEETVRVYDVLKQNKEPFYDGLPLLFAIDGILQLKNGFRYNPEILDKQLLEFKKL